MDGTTNRTASSAHPEVRQTGGGDCGAAETDARKLASRGPSASSCIAMKRTVSHAAHLYSPPSRRGTGIRFFFPHLGFGHTINRAAVPGIWWPSRLTPPVPGTWSLRKAARLSLWDWGMNRARGLFSTDSIRPPSSGSAVRGKGGGGWVARCVGENERDISGSPSLAVTGCWVPDFLAVRSPRRRAPEDPQGGATLANPGPQFYDLGGGDPIQRELQ